MICNRVKYIYLGIGLGINTWGAEQDLLNKYSGSL